MISTLRRGVNAVLFAIACLFAADTANAILAAVLLPTPEREAEGLEPEPLAESAWRDRQAILDRNVFASSTLAPPPTAATEVEDDLEATQLPLTLLGTAASENPRFAWAAIQDRDARNTLVVGIGGSIDDKAIVVRIERQRVVLLEGGVHRELVLEETAAAPQLALRSGGGGGGGGGAQPLARDAEGRRAAAARSAERRLARTRLAEARAASAAPVPREQVQQALRNPAELFSQARMLPKYEEGQMRGVQVSQIKPGSLFEQVGLREGDVITSLNGVSINGPEQSTQVLQELTQASEIVAEVIGADGTPRQVSGTVGE
jgi:general secretion pathway protein C